MATRFEIYTQSLLDLKRSIAELDQVHASLKDIRLNRTLVGRYVEQRTIKDILGDLDLLLHELNSAECRECSHRIASHGGPSGCRHEIAPTIDTPAPCGTMMLEAQICGCRWGLADPNAKPA
jgi:hypothetical protein